MNTNNFIEQIVMGFEYAKEALSTVNVSGIENMQKLLAVHNNIDVFLNSVKSGKVVITEPTETKEMVQNNVKDN